MSRRDPEAFLASLHRLDNLLAERGYPRISPWWWRELERFYMSGKRRLVVRKGRRVGASTIVAPRLAVAEALWGQHVHTPGAPPLAFVFLSVRRDEAANRLRGITAILDVLGIGYDQRGEAIELRDRPVVFMVHTASFRTAVGDTVAFAWCDELARWNDDGANPATQIVSSLAPALATLPDARLFLVSTPIGLEDYHARQIERGDTDDQNVAIGATWEINPTLSADDCRALEPDPDVFEREYGAVPSQGQSTAFVRDDVLGCFEHRDEYFELGRPFMVIDAAERHDEFAFCLARWCEPDRTPRFRPLFAPPPNFTPNTIQIGWETDANGERIRLPVADRPLLSIFQVGGWGGRDRPPMDVIIRELGALAHRFDVSQALGDQRGAEYLQTLLSPHRLNLRSFDLSQSNKHEAVTLLRRLMRDRQMHFTEDAEFKRQLCRYRRVVSGEGFKYGVSGVRDDRAALLLPIALSLLVPHGTSTRSQSVSIDGAPSRYLSGRHIAD